MIIVDCVQGSPEWHEARRGVATASEFGKIITPSGRATTGDKSSDYMHTLIGEILTGEPTDFFKSSAMQRGTDLEPVARDFYAFSHDCDPVQVGLVYLDEDRRVACSPDALVDQAGLWECKCPLTHTHVKYLVDGEIPAVYIPQVQGQLWVTGRDWCDFMSYHPKLRPFVVRVYRDERYIITLSGMVARFVDEMQGKLVKLAA